MFMIRTLAAAAFILFAAAGAAFAGQDDGRLNALFDRLGAAKSPVEARSIENMIWKIWIDPNDMQLDALMNEGVEAMSTGRLDAARQFFTDLTRRAPNFAEGWNKLATVEYLQKDYDASVADIARTLKLEPRHFGALSGLGMINLTLGRDAAALKAFERALEVDPFLVGGRETVKQLRERLKGEPI